MSNEKNVPIDQSETDRRPVRRLTRGSAKPNREVEVIALEIDDDFDLGGDPYNHTGSHCVVKLRDD